MNNKVSTERDGDVLVILINNPPINAGSIEVRTGILEAIGLLQRDHTLKAGVIMGGGKTFIAGSDLREFGRPLEEPQLPAVIAAVEACAKPVVAALHGAALGGGFEFALGCDARVASQDSIVGLPEVTLGMIPGAGGTQRLPRLVGAAQAIRLICAGERLKSAKALQAGIVDAVVSGDLRQAAVQFAAGMADKRRVRDLPVPHDTPEAIAAAAQDATRAGRARPNVIAAIEMVRAAVQTPIDEALLRERALFQQFRMSTEAAALRHLFFAERESAKHPGLAGKAPRPLHRIGVVGGGTMGSGIAICAVSAGFDVVLIERDAASVQACEARLCEYFAARVQQGKMDSEAAAACEARLSVSTDWGRLATVDLAIEAVFEDLATKQDVFRKLDAVVRAGAVLASNTSYLDLDAIAAATQRPQDVLGLHFFSPAPVMRLLEIVRGQHTDSAVLATGLDLAQRLKKQPVIAENAFGFIGNRIYNAYRRQAEFMLEEGALPEQVDAALTAFGFSMGPFAVADMSGLDIAWRMRSARAGLRDPQHRYVDIPDLLCEQGRFGSKSGAGYYRHVAGERKGQPDELVHALLREASARKGIVRRQISAEEVVRRALLAMVNEAACLLAQGVATRPSDIDVVMVHGYGFPRWEGGPVFWALQKSTAELAADIGWLAQLSGAGFVEGDLETLASTAPARAIQPTPLGPGRPGIQPPAS